MSGFDHVVKNMIGISPKELGEQIKQALPMIQKFIGNVETTLKHFDTRLATLEKRSEEIAEMLRAAEKKDAINIPRIITNGKSGHEHDGQDGREIIRATGDAG